MYLPYVLLEGPMVAAVVKGIPLSILQASSYVHKPLLSERQSRSPLRLCGLEPWVVMLLCVLLVSSGCTSTVSSPHLSPSPKAAALTHLTEFALPTTNGGPLGITTGPDGNLWFTEFNGNRIGRITPTGRVTLFPLPPPYEEPNGLPTPFTMPIGITAGRDGNLWFTTNNGIGRITPKGTFTGFYPLPLPNSAPAKITTGLDGNLWFTEQGTDTIGRITLSGSLTEFPLPTANTDPWGITAGPDGNLWFTERGRDIEAPQRTIFPSQIGRITPKGAITEFPLPRYGNLELGGLAYPSGITAGPDGNLWFPESWHNKIGRITPLGILTEFALPTLTHDSSGGSEFPLAITADSDGNLWFTTDNGIGRITPIGTVTEFAPLPRNGLNEITTGPDGNLWFTEEGQHPSVSEGGQDWIGRIALGRHISQT